MSTWTWTARPSLDNGELICNCTYYTPGLYILDLKQRPLQGGKLQMCEELVRNVS